MKLSRLLVIAGSAMVLPFVGAQTIIDSFADGERDTQDVLNNSLDWSVASTSETTYPISGGSLPFYSTANSSSSLLWAYLTDTGNYLNLGVGGGTETLKVTINLTITGLQANNQGTNFRMALINSQGTRLAGEGVGSGGTAATNSQNIGDTGYYFSPTITTSSTKSDPFVMGYRSATGSSSWLNTGGNWTLFTGTGTAFSATADGNMQIILTVTNKGAAGVALSAQYSQGATVVSRSVAAQTTSVLTSFDTFAIRVANSTALGTDVQLNDITFQVIPEPATYGVLAGMAALGLAFWRRRKA